MAAIPATSLAGTITDQTIFQGSGSMWGPGASSVYDASFFYGKSWNVTGSGDSPNIVNGVACPLGCYGGAAWASTSGKAGFELTVHSDSGSANATNPASVTLSAGAPDANGNVLVTSSAALGSGTLNTSFPNASVSGDVIVQASASLGGELCTIACVSGQTGDLLGVNWDIPVFSYNQNDNGKLQLFSKIQVPYAPGATIDLKAGEPDDPLRPVVGHLQYNAPNLNLSGSPGSITIITQPPPTCFTEFGFKICSPNPPELQTINGLEAKGSSNILNLTADVLNLGLSALDLPPISWSVGVGPVSLLDFSALQINIGPSMGINQDLLLTPPDAVQVDLHVEETGQDYIFNAGDSIEIPSDGFSALHLDPTYTLLGSQFYNESYISMGFGGSLKGLCGTVLGIGGCLDEQDWTTGDDSVLPFYLQNWGYNYEPVQGQQLIAGTFEGSPTQAPEPATNILIGATLVVAVRIVRRRRGVRF
jgi:hypothetical protein